jgi:hypothetical protein
LRDRAGWGDDDGTKLRPKMKDGGAGPPSSSSSLSMSMSSSLVVVGQGWKSRPRGNNFLSFLSPHPVVSAGGPSGRGPFSSTANSWDDFRGPNKESLAIGCVTLKYKKSTTGTNEDETKYVDGVNSPPPREVKAAIHLLLLLRLRCSESGGVHTDTLMRRIACGRSPNPSTNTNRLDKNFSRNFINVLNLNLTLNDFALHSCLPGDMDEDVKNKCTKFLTHNHKILVHYFRSTNPDLFDRFSKNANGISIFDAVTPPISTILSTRRDIKNKLGSGVCTCWRTYEQSNTRKKLMWIHHAFLLQFIIPSIKKHLYKDNRDSTRTEFLANLTIKHTFTEKNTIMLAWKGEETNDLSLF